MTVSFFQFTLKEIECRTIMFLPRALILNTKSQEKSSQESKRGNQSPER